MILERETYFPYPFHKRIYLFIKKFFYILVRFLGRPTWGRPKAGIKLDHERHDMVLLLSNDNCNNDDNQGQIKCNSCNLCITICPTHCLELKLPKGKVSPVVPLEFNFKPLECMYCNLCEEVCPEDALAFIADTDTSGTSEDKWVRDLNYLSFRPGLNEGKGLTWEQLTLLRKG